MEAAQIRIVNAPIASAEMIANAPRMSRVSAEVIAKNEFNTPIISNR